MQTSGSRYKTEVVICSHENGELSAKMKQLSDRDNHYNLYPLFHNINVLDNLDNFIRKIDYRKRKLPSILLITLPKSGSMYICNSLMGQCGLRPVITGDHTFPFAPIYADKLKKFALGCAIDQAHYMPTTKNLSLLKEEGILKLVVHFRDPRQALLSWVHYVDKLNDRGIVQWEQDVELPSNYFTKSLEEKTDFMIEHFYPHLVSFISKWLCYERDGVSKWGIEVLFTEFRKMKNTPDYFFEEICKFYNIKLSNLDRNYNSTSAHSHDRKGEVDEWRKIFTVAQIDRTTAMLNDDILERFVWSK